jgi:uncharacterized protein YukE
MRKEQATRDAANEIAELKLTLGVDIQKYKDEYEKANAEATDISEALDALRAKVKDWENGAAVIKENFDSKLQSPLS